jgi:hypothetical protein
MSPNQPSKQKRASQNKAQRSALQQRKAAAQASPSSGSGSGSSSGSSGGGGGLFGRLRGSMSPGAGGGGAGRTRATGGGSGGGGLARTRAAGAALRPNQPLGYRAALTGFLASLASLLLCVLAIRVPVDGGGDIYSPEGLAAEWVTSALDVAVANPTATAAEVADEVEVWTPNRDRELIGTAIWPLSLAFALPVIGSFAGFRAVSKRRPGKVVNRAMFATLLGAFLTQGLFLLFLPSVIGLGIASFQIRKAEVAAAQDAAAADQVDDGEVIDAEIVEDDPAGDAGDADDAPGDTTELIDVDDDTEK